MTTAMDKQNSMTLDKIEVEFMLGQIPPARIAELRVILAGKYSYAMGKLEEILEQKPIIWNSLRPDYKSDAATERAWEATEYGLAEMKWNMQRKKIEKMLSASKSLLDVKTAEAYNQM